MLISRSTLILPKSQNVSGRILVTQINSLAESSIYEVRRNHFFGANLSIDSRDHPISRARQLTSEARNRENS